MESWIKVLQQSQNWKHSCLKNSDKQKQSQNPNAQSRVRLYKHSKVQKVQLLNTFRTGTNKVLRCLTPHLVFTLQGLLLNCLQRNSISAEQIYIIVQERMAEETKPNFQQGQDTKKQQLFVHLGNFAYKSNLHEDTTLFPAVNLHVFMLM